MTVSLTFDKYGNARNRAVVLVHPFPFRAQFWSEIAPKISDSGFLVLAPNLRGCADSPMDDAQPDINLLATDVWKMLAEQGIGQAYVLGVSLGGYVSLAMLRSRPAQILGLGLIDTKVTADSPAAIRNRQRIATEVKSDLSVTDYAKQLLPTLLSNYTHENRPEVVKQVEAWIGASKADTIAWLQHAMAGRPDSSEVLAEFSGPTLLIRGADDVVSKPDDFMTMQKLAKEATFIELPNCGHLPPIEDPEKTATTIISWLISS